MLLDETPPTGRVGYVLKMYPRFSETFVVNELLALEQAGTSIDLFSLRPPADGRFHESLAEVQAEVTYVPVPSRATDLWAALSAAASSLPDLGEHLDDLLDAAPTDALQAVQVAAAVRQRGISHLHAHFGSVATTVARLAARVAGVTYTFTAHAKDIFHEQVDPADLRRKLADAQAVVTVSDHNLAHLRLTFGADADRVQRVYNGLDLERFPFVPSTGSTTGPPVVAAVGRLVEKKGFDDLVRAVALLLGEGRQLRLDVIGTGPLRAPLEQLVHELGIGEQVWLLGAQPQGVVREMVSEATVFAAPCVVGLDGNRDGLPTVLLEAMALGTPCVATPVTGIPEAVEHEVTGLLVPEHDPAALARALGRLLDDQHLAGGLARRARELIEREFDVHRQAASLRAVFAGGPPTVEPVPVPVRSNPVSAVTGS